MTNTPEVPQPEVPQKVPCPVDVEAGKKYFWCTCGRSAKQPFCDGSHQGTAFTPLPWTSEDTRRLYFCGCKHTANAPFCDGAHARL